MSHHHGARRNSMGGSASRRMSNSTGGRGVSLGEALEGGRKSVPLSKEDHSISISSAYSGNTADPTDFTERSMSSSVCLSETGQVMVSSRMHSPKYGRSTPPSFLPPPPLTEGQAEVQKLPRKPKSMRRSSMFGSTTPAATIVSKPCPDSLTASPKVTKPRRRSFFGSGTAAKTIVDQDLHLKPQSEHFGHQSTESLDLHDDIIEMSPASKPKSSFRSAIFNSSGRSFDTEGTEDNKSTGTRNSKNVSGRKLAKFFTGSHHKKSSKKDDPLESGEISKTTVDSRETHQVEAGEDNKSKKSMSRRRRSLFGSAGGASKVSQNDSHPPRPPPTPNHATRRRRSLFGNIGGESLGTGDAAMPSPSVDSPKAQKPSFRRLLGNKGSETETATLTPRTNNPYELVNNERVRRQMQPFIRSMLLDSVAKDVALQLSRSNGAQCRPTDYHGNIGKGVDIWTIHEKMMAEKGTEKLNIISSQFYQYGIGMARDRDGQIYLCQLFQ